MQKPVKSLYQIGCSVGADDLVTQAHKAPVPLASELQALIRSLPKPATGKEIVNFMVRGLALAQRAGEPQGVEQLKAAIKDPSIIGIKTESIAPARQANPFMPTARAATEETKYLSTSPQVGKAIQLVTIAVAQASSDIGVQSVKTASKQQLVEDLKKSLPEVDSKWFWIKVGGGAIAAFALYRMLTESAASAIPPWLKGKA